MFVIRIVEWFAVLWASIAMLRFFLQRGGLHISHPLAQWLHNLTQFVVAPARKIIKPIAGWDMAIVAVVFFVLLLVQIIAWGFLSFARLHMFVVNYLYVIGSALLQLTQATAYALIACLVIQMVLSFSDPYNSLSRTVNAVLRPFTKPFSMLRIGQFDFSGSLIFLALWLWVSIAVPYLRYKL